MTRVRDIARSLDIQSMGTGRMQGAVQPKEAVKAYHDALRKQDLAPHRDLAADNQITEAVLQLG